MPRPLEGCSFSLSGFVNPERGSLRQVGLDLGAKYDPEWTSSTTHLICAVAGTPKALQVQKEKAATRIVAKEWLSACLAAGRRQDEESFDLASAQAAGRASSSTNSGHCSTSQGVVGGTSSARGSSISAASPAAPLTTTTAPPSKRLRLPPGNGRLSRSDARGLVAQWVKDEAEAFASFLQDSAAFHSSQMPLGFMARSGLIDSLMFAETTLLNTLSLSDMMEAWAPPLPQAVLVVSQDLSNGVYGDAAAAAAVAAAADLATMRRMYECILGGDFKTNDSAPAFMSGYSVYVDPAGQPEQVERVSDEVSRRGACIAGRADVSVGCSCVVVTSQRTWAQDLFRQGCGVSVVSWNWVSE